jgi:hypothetical protein
MREFLFQPWKLHVPELDRGPTELLALVPLQEPEADRFGPSDCLIDEID